MLVPGKVEDQKDCNLVEVYLKNQFEKLLKGNLALAHEIAGYKQETVDAGLAPHSEQPEKYGVGRGGVAWQDKLVESGVDYKVVRHYHEHADYAVEFKI
jgi:hypothetical protein